LGKITPAGGLGGGGGAPDVVRLEKLPAEVVTVCPPPLVKGSTIKFTQAVESFTAYCPAACGGTVTL